MTDLGAIGGVAALHGETDRSMLRRGAYGNWLPEAILKRPALRAVIWAGDTGGGLAAFIRRACDNGVTDLASELSVCVRVCGGGVTALDPGGGVIGLFGDIGL